MPMRVCSKKDRGLDNRVHHSTLMTNDSEFSHASPERCPILLDYYSIKLTPQSLFTPSSSFGHYYFIVIIPTGCYILVFSPQLKTYPREPNRKGKPNPPQTIIIIIMIIVMEPLLMTESLQFWKVRLSSLFLPHQLTVPLLLPSLCSPTFIDHA